MAAFPSCTLAVYGPGLLGGSLLMDARARGTTRIQVWARREETLEGVRSRQLADFASTDARAVAQGADLIVLCVPVGAMEALAREICEVPDQNHRVVTDVGSVKLPVLTGAGAVFAQAGIPFVGSHPMAGAETTGLDAARAGLFHNAPCILTPDPSTPPEAIRLVQGFWEELGCRVTSMDAATHDALVARISHLPHLAAVAATLASFKPDPTHARLAAGGLRDTTRVASGPPGMWREILMENRAAILPALQDLHAATSELLQILQEGNDDRLLALLEEARNLRATRY